MISHTAIILPEPPTNSLDGLSNKSGNKEGQLHNHPAMLYEPCIVLPHTLSCIMVHFTSQNNLCICKMILSKMFVDNHNSFSYGITRATNI